MRGGRHQMTAHQGWGVVSLLALLLSSPYGAGQTARAPGLRVSSTVCSLGLEFYMSLVRYNPKDHKCGRFQLKGLQGERLQVREGTDVGNSESFMKKDFWCLHNFIHYPGVVTLLRKKHLEV